MLEDITERRRSEQHISYLAHNDSLTGLPNRTSFLKHLFETLDRASKDGRRFAIMCLDLDRFKSVNDSCGHATGDGVIRSVARSITGMLRPSDRAARFGGEEFAIILPNTSGEQAFAMAERLRQTVWELNLPHTASSVADRVTISIGVACLKRDTHESFDKLLRHADYALYRAKENRNRVVMAD